MQAEESYNTLLAEKHATKEGHPAYTAVPVKPRHSSIMRNNIATGIVAIIMTQHHRHRCAQH